MGILRSLIIKNQQDAAEDTVRGVRSFVSGVRIVNAGPDGDAAQMNIVIHNHAITLNDTRRFSEHWQRRSSNENGNVRANSRVLTALVRTSFTRNEVEEFKGKLNTWM